MTRRQRLMARIARAPWPVIFAYYAIFFGVLMGLVLGFMEHSTAIGAWVGIGAGILYAIPMTIFTLVSRRKFKTTMGEWPDPMTLKKYAQHLRSQIVPTDEKTHTQLTKYVRHLITQLRWVSLAIWVLVAAALINLVGWFVGSHHQGLPWIAIEFGVLSLLGIIYLRWALKRYRTFLARLTG